MRQGGPLTAVASGILATTVSLVLGGCGAAGAPSNDRPAVAQVTQAAYVTSRGPGYRMTLKLSGNLGGEAFSVNMKGAFDDQGRRGVWSESVGGKTVEALMDLPYGYVRAKGTLIRGKPWGEFDVAGLMQALGASDSVNTSSDPSEWIDFLRAAGHASAVGHETVRGVPTTHYHSLVDFARFQAVVPARLRAGAKQEAALLERISGQSDLPIDVWVDGRNLIRRYQVQVPICFQGERASESVSAELYDYGTQSIPQPPPASEVVNLTSEVDKNTSRGVQQLHC